MATYNVVKAKSATLVAATADTINFSRPGNRLRVINRDATNGLSFTFANGGATATPATALGDDTYYCGPNAQILVPHRERLQVTQVSIIPAVGAVTPAYTVQAEE